MIIRVKELGINAVSILVDGHHVQLIEIDNETEIEANNGNIDVINALATYIQNNGVKPGHKVTEEYKEANGIKGNYYLIENVKKLGMFHRYAQINVLFDLIVQGNKILLKRVQNVE